MPESTKIMGDETTLPLSLCFRWSISGNDAMTMATCWPAIVTNNQLRLHWVPAIAIRCWHFARLFSHRRSSVDWAMHCTSLAWARAFAIDAPYSIDDNLWRKFDDFYRHDLYDDGPSMHSIECTMVSSTHCSVHSPHYCWQHVHCICSTYCCRCHRHHHHRLIHPNEISTRVANAAD